MVTGYTVALFTLLLLGCLIGIAAGPDTQRFSPSDALPQHGKAAAGGFQQPFRGLLSHIWISAHQLGNCGLPLWTDSFLLNIAYAQSQGKSQNIPPAALQRNCLCPIATLLFFCFPLCFFELRLRRLPAVAAEDGYTDSAAHMPSPAHRNRQASGSAVGKYHFQHCFSPL